MEELGEVSGAYVPAVISPEGPDRNLPVTAIAGEKTKFLFREFLYRAVRAERAAERFRVERESPQSEDSLHQEADAGNAGPTAQPHKDWFTAGFNELYDIGIESDCAHRHNNKEFTQRLER